MSEWQKKTEVDLIFAEFLNDLISYSSTDNPVTLFIILLLTMAVTCAKVNMYTNIFGVI